MQVAFNEGEQRSVVASSAAPSSATCPRCGGKLLLRNKRRMDRTVVYFWRHQDNKNRECSNRPANRWRS